MSVASSVSFVSFVIDLLRGPDAFSKRTRNGLRLLSQTRFKDIVTLVRRESRAGLLASKNFLPVIIQLTTLASVFMCDF